MKPLENLPKMTCREYSASEPTIDVDCAKSLLSTPVQEGEQELALVRHSPLQSSKKPRNVSRLDVPLTLAHVMQRVESSPDLREAKRRDVLSALRTLAHCIGKPPEQISAAPKSLQREMAAVNYLQAGIGKSRWVNVKSLARKGLRVAGIEIMPGRRRNSIFSPAWCHLRDQCRPSHQMGLSRIMNHCSANGIEPDAVNEIVFSQFELELTDNSLELDSRKIYAQTSRIWDKAAETVPDWPAFRTGVATRPRGYSRPWSVYPQSLLRDIDSFSMRGSAEHCDTNLDEDVPTLSPATIKGRRITLRLLVHALAESGYQIENITGLDKLVEPNNAKEILEFFIRRKGVKKNAVINGYATLLRTIAKHWVKADRETLDVLKKYSKSTFEKQRGMTPKNRERLRQFDDPANVSVLYVLPAKLMKMARAAEKNSEASFRHATYAVAIEILLRTAVRVENLYGLSLKENIDMPTDVRNGNVILTFPHYAVKNDQDLTYELPPEFARMIREYLTDFRFGAAVGSSWLFPNDRGERRNKDGFAQQLKTIVYRYTGITINVHLYRGLMVKMYTDVHPRDFETVSKMLGHRDIRTTMRAYSEGKTIAGQRAFADIIDRKRQEVEHAPRRRS
jgi:integrase